MARWGMPTIWSQADRSGCNHHPPRDFLAFATVAEPNHRCLVPFTTWPEDETLPNGTMPSAWFMFDEPDRLRSSSHLGPHTGANVEVGAIHPKAMPASGVGDLADGALDRAKALQWPLSSTGNPWITAGSLKPGRCSLEPLVASDQPIRYLHDGLFHALTPESAFPYNGHAPPLLDQRGHGASIASGVPPEFGLPELGSSSRHRGVAATGMPVPEATVNEDCRPILWQKQIRSSRHACRVESVTKSADVKRSPQSQLGARVLAPYGCHVAGPCFKVLDVRHRVLRHGTRHATPAKPSFAWQSSFNQV